MSTIATETPGRSGPRSDDFLKGLWRENPVFVQVLGMCPTLAVTNTTANALSMGLATTFVLLLSNTLVCLLKDFIPHPVRIASYIVIIATFVTVVDYLIQAISLDLHKGLGPYVSLIVVNCIILGRAESFASKNNLGPSLLDALGIGAGFVLALGCLGIVRELLGGGTLLGLRMFPQNYEPWVIMQLPSGGFFTLGIWMLLFNAVKTWNPKAGGHRK